MPVPGEVGLELFGGDVGVALGGCMGAPGLPGVVPLGGDAEAPPPGDAPPAACAKTAPDSIMPTATAGMENLLMIGSCRWETHAASNGLPVKRTKRQSWSRSVRKSL